MAALFRQASRSTWLNGFRFCHPCALLRGHYSATAETTTAVSSIGQKWYNELGSTMVITSYDSKTGVFSGNYQSLVGDATKWYILTGRKDTDGNSIGWTVSWQNSNNNAHSVTTWSGQFQLQSFGDPIILTTWLLTSQITPDDDWESTQVGFDQFSLTKPMQEKPKLHCRKSHPKET